MIHEKCKRMIMFEELHVEKCKYCGDTELVGSRCKKICPKCSRELEICQYCGESMHQEKLFKVFTPPFWYDEHSQMIFDSNNNMALEVRGWGLFQFQENPHKLQDAFAQWILDYINKEIENNG